MPTIQSDWQGQLNSLRNANSAAERRVTEFARLFNKNQATQPQLDQAKLAQLQAAQKYNSSIESGRQLIKIGTDAEARLKSSNPTLLERSQAERSRDVIQTLGSQQAVCMAVVGL